MSSVIPDCYCVVRYQVERYASGAFEWPTMVTFSSERCAALAVLRDHASDRNYFLVVWHYVGDEARFVRAGRGRGVEYDMGDFALRHLACLDYRDWMRRELVHRLVASGFPM